MIRIEYLPELHALEITMVGFLTNAEIDDYIRDLGIAVFQYTRETPPTSLYNYTDAAIQTQAVIAQLQDVARQVRPGRKIALYTEGQLARMQVRRIAAECPTMVVFDTRSAAITWLRADPRQATVAA